MNYACANCRQNPVSSPDYYCNACSTASQSLSCANCGAANQPGQPACWQCNAALTSPPPQPMPPINSQANWQCKCGYAFNVGPSCSNCHQAKAFNPWKCDTCGYEYNLYEACDKCKNPKGKTIYPPPPNPKAGPKEPWKCPNTKCGYEYNLEGACLKCKTAKPKPKPKPGHQPQSCCAVF